MPKAAHGHRVPVADIAATMVFLASEGAKSIHGAAIPITGLS